MEERREAAVDFQDGVTKASQFRGRNRRRGHDNIPVDIGLVDVSRVGLS